MTPRDLNHIEHKIPPNVGCKRLNQIRMAVFYFAAKVPFKHERAALRMQGGLAAPDLSVGPARLAKDELQRHLLASAQNRNADRVPSLVAVHDRADVLRVGYLLAVDGHNQVAADHDRRIAKVSLLVSTAQAGALRRSAGDHFLDEHASVRRQSHLLREFR